MCLDLMLNKAFIKKILILFLFFDLIIEKSSEFSRQKHNYALIFNLYTVLFTVTN